MAGFKYYRIEQLIVFIDWKHQAACRRIFDENRKLFETARGSTFNHQAWPGGYIDHITDGMNLVLLLYRVLEATGRPLPFTLSDALLVFFLHDLEKPWRIQVDAAGNPSNRADIQTKEQFRDFRARKILEYGIELSDDQLNALRYVEGESKDYTNKHRAMKELATLCHIADTWCARGWHNYPKPDGQDEWIGADRFREAITE